MIVVVGALFGVVAGVLALGGLAKLRDPAATTPMLRTLGLPSSVGVARVLGVGELGIGAAAFLLGGRVLAVVVAVLFAGFTVSILRLQAAGDPAVSCGCFGRSSAPPSVVHVVVDALATIVAVVAVAVAAPGFVGMRTDLPGAGISYVLVVAVAVGLVVGLMTALPEALAAARRVPASEAGQARPVHTFRLGVPSR